MRLSIGVIIGICLIVYWWMHDHPRAAPPAAQSYNTIAIQEAA